MKTEQVTALAMDPNQNLRAAYVVWNEAGDPVVRHEYVIGWAGRAGQVVPLRFDRWLGRAVLVGTEDDPQRERYFGLLVAGEQMSELGEDVDQRVRELLRRDMEEAATDAEADED